MLILTKLKRELSYLINKISNNQGVHRYGISTIWMLFEKILRIFLGIYVGIFVAKHLGPNGFGILNYSQSFVAILSIFSTLGMDGIVVKRLVLDRIRKGEILGTVIFIKLIGGFISILIMTIILLSINISELKTLTIIIIGISLIFQSLNAFELELQATVSGEKSSKINIIVLILSSSIKIILIELNASVIYFALGLMLDSLFLAIGYYIYFIKFYSKIQKIKLKVNLNTGIEIIKESFPLMLASLSFIIFVNIDNIMINNLLDVYSVGIYSAAYKLATLWYFLPGLILNSLFPMLINSFKNQDIFNERVRYIGSFLIWSAILIASLSVLFGDYIFQITYGEKFEEAKKIFNILVWTNIFIFFNSLWNQIMVIKKKTKVTLFFHMIMALLTINFNYFFIKYYGVIGSSYALLLSLILSYVFIGIFNKEMIFIFIDSLLFGINKSKKCKNEK